MADGTDGQWGTLAFEVPDFLETMRDSINSVAEILVAALDIVLAALNLGKAYLVAFLDPVAALVQALVDELEGLLRDFQQVGLYMTGDWKLLEWPFRDLEGGFGNYERRMIGRLTDRTDPTRPDIPSTANVLGIFFYLSVDISDIQRLIRFVITLIKFFNQSYLPGSQPVPTITDIKYGADGATILQPASLSDYFQKMGAKTPPNIAQVKWVVNSPDQNAYNPFPALPSEGFIVTVSTIKDGIPIVFDRPTGTGKVEDLNGEKIQARETGVVRDAMGRPVVLHGGADMLNLYPELAYNAAIEDGKLKDGSARVYGLLPDGSPLPLELLDGYFQKSFFVPIGAVASQWMAGNEYIYTLRASDMPKIAKLKTESNGTISLDGSGIPASTLYVRVASCTKEIGSGSDFYKYDLKTLAPAIEPTGVTPSVTMFQNVEVSDASAFSEARPVVFPNAFTKDYLEALQTALVVLFLSRPDLTPLDEIWGTLTEVQREAVESGAQVFNHVAIERCQLEKMQHLAGLLYSDYPQKVEQRGVSIKKFRKDLLNQVRRVASDIYAKTGPMPAAEEAIVRQTKELRTLTWNEIFRTTHPELMDDPLGSMANLTILESLQSFDSNVGLALNPYSMGLTERVSNALFYVDDLVQDRLPQMMEVTVGSSEEIPDDTVPAGEVPAFMASLPPALLPIYEKCIESDGSIKVPDEYKPYLTNLWGSLRKEGSADVSPVFFVNKPAFETISIGDEKPIDTGVFYTRSLFAKGMGGQILQQSAIALSVAGAAMTRPVADGEWLSLRFFDTFPSFSEFLQQLVNWVKSVEGSIQSIVDTILKYIEFVEARIIDIQQLIERINSLLQTMLGFAFKIPKCSALFLTAAGTEGLVSGLVSAKDKPTDSPLAYGAGIAVVIPFGPVFIMDMLRAIFVSEEGAPKEGEMMGAAALPFPAAVGIEGLPAPVPPDPNAPPDVL